MKLAKRATPFNSCKQTQRQEEARHIGAQRLHFPKSESMVASGRRLPVIDDESVAKNQR